MLEKPQIEDEAPPPIKATEPQDGRLRWLRGLSRIGGRESWMAMVYLWLLYAMNGNTRMWFQAVQPAIVEEYDLGSSEIGLISGALTAGVGIAGLALGPWLDRGGHGWARKYRQLPIVGVYLVFSILTGIAPLTAFFAVIFAFQLIKNMASGAGETAEVTAVAEWWPLERRGFAQGLHHTALPWGTLLGGLGVSGIYMLFGSENWRFVFLFLPLLIIPIFMGYWRFATEKRYSAFVADTQARGLTPPLSVSNGETVKPPAPGALKRALRNPNIVVSALVSGIGALGYIGLSFWLAMYLAFVEELDLALVATYSILFTITGGIGQIVWGAISDRIGRKYSLILMFCWLAVGFALFQFVGMGIGVLIAVQLFAGMATNGIYPVLFAMASDSSEKGAVAIGVGMNVGGQVFGGLGPIIVGLLIAVGGGYSSPTGFMLGLYVMAGLQALAAVLVALFTRETIGPFKHLDRALVSARSCRVNQT